MGLDAVVGAFVELEMDEDDRALQQNAFAQLSTALQEAGLPAFREPEDLPPSKSWTARIGGYGSIHFLRRIAAHVWAGRSVPDPIEDATDDPLLRSCYNRGA